MKKVLKIFLINILIISTVLLSAEIYFWISSNNNLKKQHVLPKGDIQRLKFHPGIKRAAFDISYFPNPKNEWGRAPEGLEYKDKKPVVLFGCSFTYGHNLEPEQTPSYKLAGIMHRPVYNRARSGWGIQHMLYQVKDRKFYKQVPEPEFAVFIFIKDHLRRLYLYALSDWDVLDEAFYLRYKYKNGRLDIVNDNRPFFNQIRRLYTVTKFHDYLVYRALKFKKYRDKSVKSALNHFIEAKKQMERRWKNTKYAVLFYDDDGSLEDLKDGLTEAGYFVISVPELTDEDILSPEYMMEDHIHPNARAWELLAPLIADKLEHLQQNEIH